MSDFERLMRDALKSVGEGYRPADPHAAKEELFRRRRQRKVWVWAGGAVAAGATAALAFVAFVVLGQGEEGVRKATPTVTPAMSGREPDVQPIAVGKSPDGISVGGGYAWTIDTKNRVLVRIDPVDNSIEHIDINAQDPEDVLAAHGAVWVSDLTDPLHESVIRYDPLSGEAHAVRIGASADLDLAAGTANDIWVVRSQGELYRLDATSGEKVGSWPVGETVVDVSAVGSEVWLYDYAAGQVIGWDSVSEEVTTSVNVGVSENQDLVAGLRHVWFYRGDDGILLQIDKESGDVVNRFELGGSFAGLSIDKGTLWAMVNEGSGEGSLYQIDLDDSAEIAEPIPVSNTPYDVAAGYGSIWVTNNASGEVTRVSFGESAGESAPPPAVVFYYSDGNDIWAYDSNSQTTQVTDGPEPERSPTISRDGQSLVFQQGAWPSDEMPDIVSLDLETGSETLLGRGVAPAHGPDGRVAFGVPGVPGGEPPRVEIVDVDGTSQSVDLPSEVGPVFIDRIVWDPSDLFGGVLYVQTSYEFPQIHALDLATSELIPVVPQGAGEDTLLVSPSMDVPGVMTAIELCCSAYPEFDFTIARLGQIAGGPTEWRRFQETVGVDDIFDSEPGFGLYAVPAGNLDFDSDAGWTVDDDAAWFVGNGDELWLVDGSVPGVRDRMAIAGVQGIAVNPLFLND